MRRQFRPAALNHLWVADLTYIATDEGWLYLAVVLDAGSRRVVGWAMADHLRTELVLAALEMALRARRPAPGLVHHSDHGGQYASAAFGRRLREAELLASMGSVGDSFDNAVAERFFATLKGELIDRRPWPTRAAPRAPSSSTWKRGTTGGAATPPSATSARPPTNLPAAAMVMLLSRSAAVSAEAEQAQ